MDLLGIGDWGFGGWGVDSVRLAQRVNIKVECKYNKDVLKGHDANEIRVKLIEIIEEKLQEEEQ